MPSLARYSSRTVLALMVMPRSRSMSIESSTCSTISRSAMVPVCWISRSASVDLPWSIWAMIAKLRMLSIGWAVMGGGDSRAAARKKPLPETGPALTFRRPDPATVRPLSGEAGDGVMRSAPDASAGARRERLWPLVEVPGFRRFRGLRPEKSCVRQRPPLGSDRPARSCFAKRNPHEFRGLATVERLRRTLLGAF